MRMNRPRQLTLRAKLILAFCVIASFTVISSFAAVYLFQVYQNKLVNMSQNQGEPLIISTDLIEDLQGLSLQLERIKGTGSLNQRLLSLEELERQWQNTLSDLALIQSLNKDLTSFYDYNPESLKQIISASSTYALIISELSQNLSDNADIHQNILRHQQLILDKYNIEILLIRPNSNETDLSTKSLKLNLLTDIEIKINQVSALLLEALSSKNSTELSLLSRQALTKLREVESLSKHIDPQIKKTTLGWINHIRPFVASPRSVFQKGKRQIRLTKVLNTHILHHHKIIDQLNGSTREAVKFLKQEFITNANNLIQEVSLASYLLIGLALICLLSVFLIIWLFVSRSIIRPFIETSKTMQLLANGETRITLPISKDREVQKMLQSLKVLQQYVIKVNDMAEKDSLTDIYNRRYFDNLLTDTVNNQNKESPFISLLMCDLDHFKPYNDYYGHQQGDNCLKFFAQILQRLSDNTTDHVCRYGGEEFGIIILNKPAHYAESLAQLICNETSKALIPHKKSQCADMVTVSIGVSNMQVNNHHDISQLILQADGALYQAKNKGRNCILVNA